MNRLIRTKYHNHETLGEWLEGKPKELDVDATPLDSVVGNLRLGFGLSGVDLDEAVRECLTNIVARGARPIQGHNNGDGTSGYWTHVTRFGDEAAGIVEGVITEWHDAGVDPDIGDIWFALPWFIESEGVRPSVDPPC